MQNYLNLLKKLVTVAESSKPKPDRTKVGRHSVTGEMLRFNMMEGFPILQEKSTHWHSVIHELIWFLKGDTNIKYLADNKVRIWNEWADSNGDLGPIYGKQWRDFGGVDQIKVLLNNLMADPFSSRHVVSAWNPAELDQMALNPCHAFFQIIARPATHDELAEWLGSYSYWTAKKPIIIDLVMYQRSADMFLGVPFNIASYSALLMGIAKHCGYLPGEFVWTGGDVHLYGNHVEQAKELLSRPQVESIPRLLIANSMTNLLDAVAEDFVIDNYNPLPAIKAPVAV